MIYLNHVKYVDAIVVKKDISMELKDVNVHANFVVVNL